MKTRKQTLSIIREAIRTLRRAESKMRGHPDGSQDEFALCLAYSASDTSRRELWEIYTALVKGR